MKLYGVTTAYNVEDLIPYVMPYVCRLGYDKWIVYDDHSTDRTVELLSQYNFVEIRQFSEIKSNDVNEFETLKSNIAINLYSKCRDEVQKTGELIAMTVTDFDEVIYSNFTTNFKEELENSYLSDGYNYFASRMINLLPPLQTLEIKSTLNDSTLVHMIDGIRGSAWKYDGMKPLLFIVNDMAGYWIANGNHFALFNTVDDKPLRNYDNIGGYYAFHLKFISRMEYVKRQKDYQNGNMMPWFNEQHAYDIFDKSLFGSSFPLETYFCIKQMNGARSSLEGAFKKE